MTATKGNVIYLYQRDPQEALERLNRITGLSFSSWPQSLVSASLCPAQPEGVAQPDSGSELGSAEMLSG